MTDTDLQQALDFAKTLAYDAGEVMKRYFLADDIETIWKEDQTPLTIADTTINTLVINRVKNAYPEHGVDGEEEGYNLGQDYMWLCDPVDGTMPYALGLPVSTFSLALVYDGTPILGVIYDPFFDRLYYALTGQGAFLNGKGIQVRNVSLKEAYVGCDQWATGNIPHSSEILPLPKLRDELLDLGTKPITPASSIIISMLLAQGLVSGNIFGCTKPVDIAAAKVIVEEAGGTVTDFAGNEQRYDQPLNGAILSNGFIHKDLLGVVRQCTNTKIK